MPKKLQPLEGAVLWWCATFWMAWPRALMAASFATDMKGYDYASLGWAVLMSLLGGALRTIFTLATDNKIVPSFGREVFKDATVAMIAGALAYIVMEAFRGFGVMSIASEVRFAVIVFAGWSRMSFFGWLNKLGTRVADTVNDKVVAAISATTASKASANAVPIEQTPPADPAVPPPPKAKPFKEM